MMATVALSWLLFSARIECFVQISTATTHCNPQGSSFGSVTIVRRRLVGHPRCTSRFTSSARQRRTRKRIDGFFFFFSPHGVGRGSSIVATQSSSGDDDDIVPPEQQDDGNDAEDEEDEDETDEQDYLYIATKVPTADSPTWEMGNDFDQFLNQCTVQCFLFLLTTCRDPHTVQYVEKFTKPMISTPPRLRVSSTPDNGPSLPTGDTGINSKLLSYHGLAAMNTTAHPTWDSYYQLLLDQPVEEYLIESGLKYVPDYEIDINPPSLCTRMISVREQIAREMVHDLKVLSHMGDDFMAAYWDGMKNGDGDPLRTGVSAHLLFLDYLENPSAGERDYAPSPLRKGNFDLISLMATQESIHRILNNSHGKVADEAAGTPAATTTQLSTTNRQYLSHFYLQRLVSHFSNRQPYGRSTQFLLELVQSNPSISSTAESIVDPTHIAEQILSVRSVVAHEWRTRAMQVPDLHVAIKRLQLDSLMKSYDKNRNQDAFQ